ncbi:MAG: ATP-binding protein [Clostridiales Family XIII bacterium]|jgi:hypothetical protein|nr:ATP-binding protein [Clostridiales Family XIII bacterium]
MELIKGKIASAQRAVIYGPEGIGKSTLAAKIPDPLFNDTEGGTNHLDITRTPKPTSWEMLKSQVEWVRANPSCCRTLVIDTADWTEMLCVQHVCDTKDGGGKDGLEAFGYGKGYTYLAEEFGRLLHALDELVAHGIHVVFTAHATIRQTELPEETGKYEFWTLKLGKKTAPMLKEWADMVLFCNYKTMVVRQEDGKPKATGGKRRMYASHRTTWDAKNRHGLPEEMDMDYAAIAPAFVSIAAPAPPAPPQQEAPADPPAPDPSETDGTRLITASDGTQMMVDGDGVIVEEPEPPAPPPAPPAPPEPPADPEATPLQLAGYVPVSQREAFKPPPVPEGKAHLKPLYDLMEQNNVSDFEIRWLVSERGWATLDTPIPNYQAELVAGGLVGNWEKVLASVVKTREDDLPF